MSILCYHSVDPTWRSELAVTPEEFDRHCAWLARNRNVVELDRAVSMLDSRFRLPAGTVAVTFDDGLSGVASYAASSLRKHRLAATVFLIADTLTADPSRYEWIKGDPPPEPRTMTREQVLELRDAGVTFGSHSMHHHDLTTLSEAECAADLVESRQILSDLLGRPVPFLAYPGGRHDERVRRLAEKAGYDASFTLPETREPIGRHAIPPVGIYPGNGTWTIRIKDARWYLPARTSAPYGALRRLATRRADRSA